MLGAGGATAVEVGTGLEGGRVGTRLAVKPFKNLARLFSGILDECLDHCCHWLPSTLTAVITAFGAGAERAGGGFQLFFLCMCVEIWISINGTGRQ